MKQAESMTRNQSAPAARSVDDAEVARFAALASRWWDATGPYAPLHALTPARIGFVRMAVTKHLACDARSMRPFAGLSLLDVGCGGGILAEPLTRLGADVTAIDPAGENIEAARAHAAETGLEIDYRAETAEALSQAGQSFDIVVASEVIEHVIDPEAFIATLATLAKPGGLVLLSTLNRTLKSFALAIVGAEYILRWLPRGTHDWEKFITPDEMEAFLRTAGMEPLDVQGMIFNPLKNEWRLGDDASVNYWLAARKNPV